MKKVRSETGFKSRVMVQAEGGRYLYSTHREQAERLCRAGQAVRLAAGLISIASLGAVRADTQLPRIKRLGPQRRSYHQHTRPNVDRKTWPAFFYRAKGGQVGGVHAIGIGFAKENHSWSENP